MKCPRCKEEMEKDAGVVTDYPIWVCTNCGIIRTRKLFRGGEGEGHV